MPDGQIKSDGVENRKTLYLKGSQVFAIYLAEACGYNVLFY